MRILIAEDRAHNLNDSIDRLRAEGHEVVVCQTAGEAIKIIERTSHRRRDSRFIPELVLTDLELPFGMAWHAVMPGEKKTEEMDLVPHGGLAVAIVALRAVKRVGILTDTDHHHSDPIMQLLDAVNYLPGEEGEPSSKFDRPNFPIVRVEARSCNSGEIEIPANDTCMGKYTYSGDAYRGKTFAKVKDWYKLAKALMSQE